jgi:hypothetical protein
LQGQFDLCAAALHLEAKCFTGLGQYRQQEIEHLAGDLDLRAAVRSRADHLALDHLARLQRQCLQSAAARGDHELGKLRRYRHAWALAASCGATV